MQQAQSVERSSERLAKKRVILLEERTTPPSPDDIWARSWFVLYTYPGQERCASQDLEEAGFTVFLPVQTYWNSSRFRVKRQLERSLLTRYLFVGAGTRAQRYLSDRDWSRMACIEGVQSVLGDERGPVRIPVENVIHLAGEVASGKFDETRDTYAAGQAVTILKGAFSTFPAVIESAVPREAAPDDPIRVILTMFGRETMMKISLADLCAIR